MSGYSVGNVGLDYTTLLNNPYAMYNPYMNYYGMNYGNNVSFQGNTQKTDATTQKTTTNVVSKGAAKDNKSGNAAKFVIGTALTVGAAVLCRKAYVKGGGQGWFGKDFFSKTKNGFVEMFKDVKGKFPRLTDRFTMDANTKTCQIPGKMNKLEGANMANDIVRLGGRADVPNLADEGVEILGGTFQINSRSFVTFENGKIVQFKNSKGKIVSVNEMTANEQEKVAKILKRIQNKDTATLDKLTKVSYSQTQNDVTSYFAKGFDPAEDGITDGLQYGLTRKFDFDSDDVKVYLKEHEQLKKSVDEYLAGTNTNLRHAYAEYQVPAGTLRIENDKVVGIEILEGGAKKFYDIDSTKFKALDLEDTVENILDNKASFINQRYRF